MRCGFVCIVLWLNLVFVFSQKDMPEEKLIIELLKDYNYRTRPVENPTDTVNVSVSFHLTKVDNLDSDSHVLTTSGWVKVVWRDPRMTWDPADFGNISRTSLYATDIWFPDFALENSAQSFYELAHTRSFRIMVHSDGKMVWQPGGVYQTYCPIYVLYYPFDSQTCDIIFTEWGYNSDMVVLTNGTDAVYKDTGYYQSSGAWRIIRASAWSELNQYSADDEKFSRVIFRITLNRVYVYYFVTMLFPALILSGLVLLVYAVPRGSTEKLSMGLTLMLSFFVFMVNISNYVPRSTEVMPLIQIYLLFYMTITAVTVGISVMMLRFNHVKRIKKPQYWLRFIVYRIMANVICHGCCSNGSRFKYFRKDIEGNGIEKDKKAKNKKAATLAASNLMELEKLTSDTAVLEEKLEHQDSFEAGEGQQPKASSDGHLIESLDRIKKSLRAIEKGTLDMMNFIWEKESELSAEDLERIKGEWREITDIINNFSFWVLLTYTVVFIVMIITLWVSNS